MLQLKPHEVNAWFSVYIEVLKVATTAPPPVTTGRCADIADDTIALLRIRCADIDKKREMEAAELEVIRQRNLAHIMEQTAGSTRS